MDRYQVIRKLSSQGACGTVLLARDVRTNDTVVVKQLPAADQRSATERRVMRNLRHNNIVRYLESWVTIEDVTLPADPAATPPTAAAAAASPPAAPRAVRQRTLNIAMEYVGGGDLRNAIRLRRTAEGVGSGFPEAVIRRWLVQICSALYYCHAQHILHRDLKSENILLDESGAGVKVADFGFAKELTESGAFATTRLGTPHSLPPEVYDSTPYNNRADMWCLGIIVYELMTLQRPFLGNTMRELFETILRTEPVSVETASKGRYSRELYDLQRRLLSKNPKLRPSAREMLDLPWAAAMLREVRLSPLTAEQKLRDAAVWDRVTVQALHPRSVVMELALPNTTVNVRNAPSFTESTVVAQLQPGEFVEVLDEVVDAAGLKWLRTTRGFCIKMTPMPPPRDMFRRIAEWRVRRQPPLPASLGGSPVGGPGQGAPPSSAPLSPLRNLSSPTAGAADPAQCMSPLRQPSNAASVADSDELRVVEEAAKQALDAQVQADDLVSADRGVLQRFLLSSALQGGVPEALLQDLVGRYRDLSAPLDDMPWTIVCVDALRPLHLIPWIPVLRWIANIALSFAPPSPTGSASTSPVRSDASAPTTTGAGPSPQRNSPLAPPVTVP
jgi:serine/threonine protein kinase